MAVTFQYATCERCNRHIRFSYALNKFVLIRSELFFDTNAAKCYDSDHIADPRYKVDIDIPHRNRIP